MNPEFTKALCALFADMRNVKKEHTNQFAKTTFANLPDVLNSVRPTLAKHGFAIQSYSEVGQDKETERLVTRLVHGETGEWSESAMIMRTSSHKGMSEEQSYGTAQSYYRRYQILGLLGIAADDKDIDELEPPEPISEKQAATIRDLIESTESDLDKFLRYMKVDIVEDITTTEYRKAVAILEQKQRQKNNA